MVSFGQGATLLYSWFHLDREYHCFVCGLIEGRRCLMISSKSRHFNSIGMKCNTEEEEEVLVAEAFPCAPWRHRLVGCVLAEVFFWRSHSAKGARNVERKRDPQAQYFGAQSKATKLDISYARLSI